MKIVSWNVNSLKVRLPQLLDYLERAQPDVICLQEIKLENHNFPEAVINVAGYHAVFSGQKAYNGVALLSSQAIDDVVIDNPYFPDAQKRLLAATIQGIRIVCAYVPNGQEIGSAKFDYKLEWLAALQQWLAELLAGNEYLVLAGDLNIAPSDEDVHDPVVWAGQILCSKTERDAFRNLLALGLKDSFRLFEQPEKSFSWWDYRMHGFQRNLGLRIDHILLSSPLARVCRLAGIDKGMRKHERPSDHAPVWAVVDMPLPCCAHD